MFWLSSTGDPEFVVDVGTGVCSLTIFINWLVLIFRDSTDNPVSVPHCPAAWHDMLLSVSPELRGDDGGFAHPSFPS